MKIDLNHRLHIKIISRRFYFFETYAPKIEKVSVYKNAEAIEYVKK